MLGLNFDQAGTNGAMTHGLDLSAKVRMDEQLKSMIMAYSRHWQYVRARF